MLCVRMCNVDMSVYLCVSVCVAGFFMFEYACVCVRAGPLATSLVLVCVCLCTCVHVSLCVCDTVLVAAAHYGRRVRVADPGVGVLDPVPPLRLLWSRQAELPPCRARRQLVGARAHGRDGPLEGRV